MSLCFLPFEAHSAPRWLQLLLCCRGTSVEAVLPAEEVVGEQDERMSRPLEPVNQVIEWIEAGAIVRVADWGRRGGDLRTTMGTALHGTLLQYARTALMAGFLMRAGIPIDQANTENWTPFAYAVYLRNWALAGFFEANGANPDPRDNFGIPFLDEERRRAFQNSRLSLEDADYPPTPAPSRIPSPFIVTPPGSSNED